MTPVNSHSDEHRTDLGVLGQFEHLRDSGTQAIAAYTTYIGNPAELKRLEQEFHGVCRAARALMRDMEMAVDEADSEREAQELSTALSRQRYEYEEMLKAFKHAAVLRKDHEQQQKARAREELLESSHVSTLRKQWKTESDLVAASQGITESMKRTKHMLAEELEHSGAQLAALGISHETLAKSNAEYRNQHSKLKKAKGLITTVDWQNKSERYLLWAGLCMFCAVALYIIQKRSLYFVPASFRPLALFRYVCHVFFGQSMKKRTFHGLGNEDQDLMPSSSHEDL